LSSSRIARSAVEKRAPFGAESTRVAPEMRLEGIGPLSLRETEGRLILLLRGIKSAKGFKMKVVNKR